MFIRFKNDCKPKAAVHAARVFFKPKPYAQPLNIYEIGPMSGYVLGFGECSENPNNYSVC